MVRSAARFYSDQDRSWLDREQPQLILSVGAYTAVDQAEDEAELAYQVNRDAVAVLAEYANARKAPLIHLSTDYVFDGSKPAPYVESDTPAPSGVYGASKLAGEVAAQQAEQHLILRVSWVFGAKGANFVRTMLRIGTDRDQLNVVDDQIGGPTWAGHIAEHLCTLVDRHEQGQTLPTGLWHCGGAPFLSWCEFATTIFRQATDMELIERAPDVMPIPSSEYPTKAQRPANSRLDSSQARHALGLETPDWRIGLEETLNELRAS